MSPCSVLTILKKKNGCALHFIAHNESDLLSVWHLRRVSFACNSLWKMKGSLNSEFACIKKKNKNLIEAFVALPYMQSRTCPSSLFGEAQRFMDYVSFYKLWKDSCPDICQPRSLLSLPFSPLPRAQGICSFQTFLVSWPSANRGSLPEVPYHITHPWLISRIWIKPCIFE